MLQSYTEYKAVYLLIASKNVQVRDRMFKIKIQENAFPIVMWPQRRYTK